ncbi:MAG: DUF2125 domain-containing protein [Marinosulfonomonas sp.]|nr:DUF2125 domain-containing protein [Marinosulfonomonas sp.]
MRWLLGVILTVATLWSGYWFIASNAVEMGLSGWLDTRQSDGWVAEYSDVATRGFPNRLDTTITNIELADPGTGVAWKAPFFKIFALSYKPNHIIAIWPHAQTLASPYEKISVTSEDMRGSVVFTPGTSLELDRSNFDLQAVQLRSDLGWSAAVEKGKFFTRQTVGKTDTHDIWFEATNLTPSANVKNTLDPASLLPVEFETLRIDSTVAFTAPWDRFALEKNRPQISALHLKDLQATWGNLDLRAAGKLNVNSAGIPTGKITIKATNWRNMLRIAVDTGVVPQNISKTLESALEFLAGISGHPDTLDAPLTFKNGKVSFGPIPLGKAPSFAIR